MHARLAATIVALVPLALVACSSGGDGASVASLTGANGTAAAGDEAAAEVDAEEAMLEFAECMREQGIDVPDPEVNADGGVTFGFRAQAAEGEPPEFDRGELEEMQAARDECGDILEGASLGVGPGGDRPEFDSEAFLEFAECMREEGIEDFPDPDPDGRPSFEAMQELDVQSEEFQAATEACSDETMGFRFGSAGGIGGGPGGGPPGPVTDEAGTSGSVTTEGN